SGGTHADDFLGAEVGGDEGEAADPGWDGAACEEEVIGGAHVALEGETDAQHKDEVDQHNEPVDDGKIHGNLCIRSIWGYAKSFWYWGKLYILSGTQVQIQEVRRYCCGDGWTARGLLWRNCRGKDRCGCGIADQYRKNF